jgi:hypothetical protein
MYLIENSEHQIVNDGKGRQMFKSLAVVFRPDGGQTSRAKVNEQLYDEQGRSLFIREVLEPVEGDGPVNLGYGSLEYSEGNWKRPKKVGPKRPDPAPGDDDYDYASLRRRDYPSIEDQLDAQFHDAKDGTTTWVDSIQVVKDKWPKPVAAAEEPVAEEPVVEEPAVEEAAVEEAPAEEPVVEETP